jgi:PAS domain S-box-containing protein
VERILVPLRVLLVEDRPEDSELVLYELRRAGYSPNWRRVETERDYVAQLEPAPDLILADYHLPHFDGLRALEILKARGLDIPFILVSGAIGEERAVTAMQNGAADYLLKDRLTRLGPAVANALEQKRLRDEKRRADKALRESEARLSGIVASAMDAIITVDADQRMVLFNAAAEQVFRCQAAAVLGESLEHLLTPESWVTYQAYIETFGQTGPLGRPLGAILTLSGLRTDGELFPAEASISYAEVRSQKLYTVVLRDITERQRAEAELRRAHAELAQAYEATVEGWSRALELRDKETEGHTLRVTEVTLRLAQMMQVNEDDLIHIRRGALLHDIGKVGIPDGILLKPGPLTDQEWAIMHLHPGYAYEMLAPIEYLHAALDIPYYHHERWDGTGYPRGLKGEEIPLAARIFAVVDVWDALTSDRPYRPAWSNEKALAHIRSLAGSHFDPQVVEAFLKLVAEQWPEPQSH